MSLAKLFFFLLRLGLVSALREAFPPSSGCVRVAAGCAARLLQEDAQLLPPG